MHFWRDFIRSLERICMVPIYEAYFGIMNYEV